MSSQEPQAWQPTPQPPPPPPVPSGLMRNPVVPGATMTLLGGVLIVLGSFLPWLTATAPLVGTISRNGMEGGDGIITLILGVVTILIGVTQLTATNLPTLLQRSPIVTGAITGIVAVINYLNVQQRIEDVRDESEPLIGPLLEQGPVEPLRLPIELLQRVAQTGRRREASFLAAATQVVLV